MWFRYVFVAEDDVNTAFENLGAWSMFGKVIGERYLKNEEDILLRSNNYN